MMMIMQMQKRKLLKEIRSVVLKRMYCATKSSILLLMTSSKFFKHAFNHSFLHKLPTGSFFFSSSLYILFLIFFKRHLSMIIFFQSDLLFFFSSRRRHTRLVSDWSSDVCSSD